MIEIFRIDDMSHPHPQLLVEIFQFLMICPFSGDEDFMEMGMGCVDGERDFRSVDGV